VSDHAKLSPSARARWRLCPGSVREGAKYPDTAGAAAVDGTHTHTLLEKCVKNNLYDPLSVVGTMMADEDGEFMVDKDRAGRVRVAIDYIKQRVTELNGMCEVVSESRVDPAHLLGRTDMSGTVDVQIRGGSVLEIIDYKDGMNPVLADDNPQLEQYAMGVLAGFRLPINGQYPYDTVRLTIIQPKLMAKGLPAISSQDRSLMDIIRLIPRMVQEAAATDAPDAPLVPGDVQCKYCNAKGSCSAMVTATLDAAGVAFTNLDLAKEAASKEPTELSDAQIREIIEAAPMLRSMLDNVEAEALRRLKDGKSIDGLKLVHGRGSRSWALPDDDTADKLAKMGVPKPVIWQTKLISPAQLEKASWEVVRSGEKITKSLSERQLKTVKTEYIKTAEGKLTVALLSDSRPAVTVDAAPLFNAVDALPSWLS